MHQGQKEWGDDGTDIGRAVPAPLTDGRLD